MGLVSDAPFDLDKVPGRKPERQWLPGAFSGRPRLIVCLHGVGKKRLRQAQRKQPTIHGIRLGRGSGEDELPACKKRPQFAANLFVLSSLSARNARMALDLASPSSARSLGTRTLSHTLFGVAHGQLDTTAGRSL